MFLNGLGCKKNIDSAIICLREAAERGNVYAMGNLASYYYKQKLFTKAVELAARWALWRAWQMWVSARIKYFLVFFKPQFFFLVWWCFLDVLCGFWKIWPPDNFSLTIWPLGWDNLAPSQTIQPLGSDNLLPWCLGSFAPALTIHPLGSWTVQSQQLFPWYKK